MIVFPHHFERCWTARDRVLTSEMGKLKLSHPGELSGKFLGIVNARAPPLDSAQLSLPSTSDVLELQCTPGPPGDLFRQIPGPIPSVSDAVVWAGGGARGVSGKMLLSSLAIYFENYRSTS